MPFFLFISKIVPFSIGPFFVAGDSGTSWQACCKAQGIYFKMFANADQYGAKQHLFLDIFGSSFSTCGKLTSLMLVFT